MPVKEEMNWITKEKQWQKWHDGKPIKRSPKQLKKEFPYLVKSFTKEGTREAANL